MGGKKMNKKCEVCGEELTPLPTIKDIAVGRRMYFHLPWTSWSFIFFKEDELEYTCCYCATERAKTIYSDSEYGKRKDDCVTDELGYMAGKNN